MKEILKTMGLGILGLVLLPIISPLIGLYYFGAMMKLLVGMDEHN